MTGGMRGLVLAALGVLALLPFARTLTHELVWDDHDLVRQVRALDERGGLTAVAAAPFLPGQNDAARYYRPLVLCSLWVDGRLGGGAAAAYHATNVALHVLNTLLLALLLARVFRSWPAALIGSALFAVHPLQVEAVSFVAARTDLWATLFVLASTLAWLAARDAGPKRNVALASCGVFYLAACLAKESAILLPAVLLAWECLPGWLPEPAAGRSRTVTRGIAAWGAVFLALAIVRGLVLGAVLFGGGGVARQRPLLLAEPGMALAGLVRMLRLVLVPLPLNTMYTREHLVLDAVSLVVAGVLVAVFAWAGTARFRRVGLAAATWCVVFVLPTLFIPSLSATLAAERYLYLPLAGVALLSAGLVAPAWERSARVRVALPIAGVVLGSASCFLSFAHAGVWRDDLTLTERQVRTAPGSGFAHDRHGQVLLTRQRWPEALAAFEKAVALEPNDPAFVNDLGIGLRRTGRPDLAAQAFRRAIGQFDGFVEARLNLGYACISLRDAACVGEQLAALARLDPRAREALEAESRRWGVIP